jgi:alkanesulfonate monooxygenase SsuD/methylene tetrahydromethanopterin reductase-like flavin-dependent oxidoreductase (luciferase family)
VGRGVSPAELAFHGVSGEEEAQGRFDEAFAILRQGLTSDSVTFDGTYYMALETCFGDMTKEEALQSAELLATEVMPHFA